MNILFIGSSGALSLIPFQRLLSSGHNVVATGVYKPLVFEARIIALENASLALAASQADIPVIDLSVSDEDIVDLCSHFSVDVILMSCYSKRLSDAIINLATFGCYNMHPSLLPRFRGPEPVFWQMKAGGDLGVSWHRVVHDFDAGDILAQRKVFVNDGADHATISQQLAQTGALLMEKLLADIASGSTRFTVQASDIASYCSYPRPQDFVIDSQWSAQHAYNFMCATQIFGHLYRYQQGKDCFLLKYALDVDNNASIETVQVQLDRLYIPFKTGVLTATYTDKIIA